MLEIENPAHTQLSAIKKALLLKRLQKIAPSDVQLWNIQPATEQHTIPQTSTQQSLWFLNQLAPDNTVYTIPLQLHLKGPLQQQALWNSLHALVERQHILRTTFRTTDGLAEQVIRKEWELPYQYVNLEPFTEVERIDEFTRRMQFEIDRPFDLTS